MHGDGLIPMLAILVHPDEFGYEPHTYQSEIGRVATQSSARSPLLPVSAPKRYVVMPTFVQPLDRNREVASVNFCPLDISRRASSARAPISSFSHSR
jgi:hypothetical protein